MSGGRSGSGRHARARELFLDLLELPPGDRSAALEKRCAGDPLGDPDLEREVRSLLEHHREDEAATTEAPGISPPRTSSSPPASSRQTGEIFAGRYRIVAELGRGGMGEVYRAHDLVLDQPVAIKFLPPSGSRHLDALLNEVRLARQVTHPNVCRVYDFGDAGGETYLTMEYVDGEDLGSLLSRIGRLPRDKLLDVAHQLCAGLAAAHACGVLHRDLKPANVLIDGRGQVRITDFGIAAEAPPSGETEAGPRGPGAPGSSGPGGRDPAGLPGPARVVGTPAYMAPEQLAGGAASIQSDLYALGLVLHEMATGRPVFSAGTPAEYAELHRTVMPAPPSLQVEHLDPRLEEVLLRCLEKDPRDRPASAHEVAAALPGGDPLARALAAGRTPSPEAVVAAAAVASPSPAMAAALAGVLLALLAAVWLLADRAYPGRAAWARKPPAVMVAHAEAVLETLGYPAQAGVSGRGGEGGTEGGFSREDEGGLPGQGGGVLDGGDRAWGFEPGGEDEVGDVDEELFWYRRSPEPMLPEHFLSIFIPRVDFVDPPLLEPGMLRMILDARGLLLLFQVIPEPAPVDEAGATAPPASRGMEDREPDWGPLLAAAGLDPAALEPVDPGDPPPVYADRRAAWNAGGRHVRAAAWDGRMVFFEVRTPSDEGRSPTFDWDLLWSWYLTLEDVFWLVLAAAAVVLAWRNLRAGRGDLRGARRLATVMVVLAAALWAFQVDYLPQLDDLSRWELTFGAVLIQALVAWLAWVALEPVVRRFWPRALIAWSRLLAGRPRDPVVGRSLLVGAVAGTSWALLTELDRLLTVWAGLAPAPEIFIGLQLDTASSGRMAIAELLGSAMEAVYRGVLTLFFLVGLRVVVKRWGPAVVLFVVSNGVLEVLQGIHPAVSWLTLGLGIAGVSAYVLMRFGLLAYAVALFCYLILLAAPTTLDLSAWYAETGFFFLLVVAAVGCFGLWAAVAGRPVAGSLAGFEPSSGRWT